MQQFRGSGAQARAAAAQARAEVPGLSGGGVGLSQVGRNLGSSAVDPRSKMAGLHGEAACSSTP